MKICCIDTEFNAFDYKGQNGGIQEIVEIGCAVIDGDGYEACFSRRCRLLEGHVLTRRCTEITGIRPEDLEEAAPFPQAAAELRAFVKQHGALTRIWALGKEDRNQLLRTAELYPLPLKQTAYLKNIAAANGEIAAAIGTPSRNLSYSLADLCDIFEVDNPSAHSALSDALALARCLLKLRGGSFDPARVGLVAARKLYHSLYMQQRRVRDTAGAGLIDAGQLAAVEEAILRSGLEDYKRHALVDDLRQLFGYGERFEHYQPQPEDVGADG